ncbi:cupin domain-containing protein [Pseudomonas sp. CCNWLW23]|uniref:cupin domain-containing protein n=1 Tax=Pseudomonas sp. CCNWLW23 TaxID=3126385 RepID=UPI003012E84A
MFHVEKGALHLQVGDAELIVGPGCSAVARTDVAHGYANHGRAKLVFTMSVTELHQGARESPSP